MTAAGVPDPMSPWQAAGFLTGLVVGLGPLPEQAFDSEEDPEQILALDCLDELSRRIEDHETPAVLDGLLDGAKGEALHRQLVDAVRTMAAELVAQGGHPSLSFAEAAIKTQDPAKADVPAARTWARGFLRGLVMSVEDEEALSGEEFGEPLSLIFILTEDELGEEFGSKADVAEARQSVAMALPGLVAQLWELSWAEDAEA